MSVRYSTSNRKKIYKILEQSKGRTITAAEIDEKLKEMDNAVSISTIYRFLDSLQDDGTVIRYASEDGKTTYYQYVETGSGCEDHLHLKCIRCGNIQHLDCGFMEEISEHIQKDHGFTLLCKNSILYGLCSECAKAQQ